MSYEFIIVNYLTTYCFSVWYFATLVVKENLNTNRPEGIHKGHEVKTKLKVTTKKTPVSLPGNKTGENFMSLLGFTLLLHSEVQR